MRCKIPVSNTAIWGFHKPSSKGITMTTRLYLVRHGATPLTAEDRFSGAENIHLSDEGRGQVEHLAQRLADDKIEAVYSSPLDRTLETASIIAKFHKLTSIPKDGLREISHG